MGDLQTLNGFEIMDGKVSDLHGNASF